MSATTALDAPTVRITVGATESLDPAATQPVPVRPVGYPVPGAYRVPPLVHPHVPAGSGPAGVPWGPPSGPLPVATFPTMPRPAGRARRGPVAALAATALALGLLVGGGIAVYAGSGDAPAAPVAVTWSGATVGE